MSPSANSKTRNLRSYLSTAILRPMALRDEPPSPTSEKRHSSFLDICLGGWRQLVKIAQYPMDRLFDLISADIEHHVDSSLSVEMGRATMHDPALLAGPLEPYPLWEADIPFVFLASMGQTSQVCLHTMMPDTRKYQFQVWSRALTSKNTDALGPYSVYVFAQWQDDGTFEDPKMVVICLSPRRLDAKRFTQFANMPEFFSDPTSTSYQGLPKYHPDFTFGHLLWAKISDICTNIDCPFFAISTYEQWAFGKLTEKFYKGLITAPLSKDHAKPRVLEIMVHWLLMAVKTPKSYLEEVEDETRENILEDYNEYPLDLKILGPREPEMVVELVLESAADVFYIHKVEYPPGSASLSRKRTSESLDSDGTDTPPSKRMRRTDSQSSTLHNGESSSSSLSDIKGKRKADPLEPESSAHISLEYEDSEMSWEQIQYFNELIESSSSSTESDGFDLPQEEMDDDKSTYGDARPARPTPRDGSTVELAQEDLDNDQPTCEGSNPLPSRDDAEPEGPASPTPSTAELAQDSGKPTCEGSSSPPSHDDDKSERPPSPTTSTLVQENDKSPSRDLSTPLSHDDSTPERPPSPTPAVDSAQEDINHDKLTFVDSPPSPSRDNTEPEGPASPTLSASELAPSNDKPPSEGSSYPPPHSNAEPERQPSPTPSAAESTAEDVFSDMATWGGTSPPPILDDAVSAFVVEDGHDDKSPPEDSHPHSSHDDTEPEGPARPTPSTTDLAQSNDKPPSKGSSSPSHSDAEPEREPSPTPSTAVTAEDDIFSDMATWGGNSPPPVFDDAPPAIFVPRTRYRRGDAHSDRATHGRSSPPPHLSDSEPEDHEPVARFSSVMARARSFHPYF